MSEPDILEKLRDLHVQATKERSHHYTGKCIEEAIEEITSLRRLVRLSGSVALSACDEILTDIKAKRQQATAGDKP